jgi:hypothetical protein
MPGNVVFMTFMVQVGEEEEEKNMENGIGNGAAPEKQEEEEEGLAGNVRQFKVFKPDG